MINEELFGGLPTPCFLIDTERLDKNVVSLKEALQGAWPNWSIGYSVKTNNVPWVLGHMRELGCMAEVVSADEYDLAKMCGYEPHEIIYNGPVKGYDQLEECIKEGGIVNLDSWREIDWVRRIASATGCSFKVGLRVNFDIDALLPNDIGCNEFGTRFGFSVETGALERAIDALTSIPNVVIAGLHMHSTSKTRGVEVYSVLAQKASELVLRFGLSPEYVDIGGGFFGDVPGKPTFEDYIGAIAVELGSCLSPASTKLIVEPGSALIASPVYFLTTVVDVKDVARARVVVLDGGRPNVDPLNIKNRYDYRVIASSENRIPTQVIAGYTCMETDRLLVLSDERELQPNDRMIFERVGSYTMSLNPLFITWFPAVYACSDRSCLCVREKWTTDKLL